MSFRKSKLITAGVCTLGVTSTAAIAGPFFDTTLSGDYLIVARMALNGNTDVATNNFELGANKAPVPANTSFLDSGGGPTLEGSVPTLPSGITPFFQGVGGHGNIAIMDPNGEFELQDVGVYADASIGIRLAGSSSSLNKSSNAFFNDPNMFPNTFDVGTQTGLNVNPGDADQSTRIDADGTPGNKGVTYNYDHSMLSTELSNARTTIDALTADTTLDTGGDGVLDSDTTINLAPGVNVIDIDTGGGNDFVLNNMNLVIDGPAGSSVIFRLMGNDNMLISQANILVGDGGIGRNSILFYTSQGESDTHFSFNNTLINGAAFWSLGDNGGGIDISNAQGSTQLIADTVDLDNVRFTRWAFNSIPAPSSAFLIAAGMLAHTRRRR